ncbi:uncharacterized protein [Ptychodera flava]|uniref:uncharacterized protein n=1 Tax=Ptychodera flava TaxID=63121 RepID=UPI00396A56DB
MTTVSETTTAEHGPHIITLPGGVVIDDDDLRNDTGPETHKELLLSKYSVKFRESIQSMLRSYSNIPIEALTTIYFEDYDNNRTSTFQSRVRVDDAKRTMAFLADLLGYGNMSLSTGEIIRTTMFLNDVATTTFVDLKKTDFEMIGFDLPGMVQAFIRTSNGLVDTRYNSKWNQLKDEFVGPSAVVTAVDKFTESIAHLLEKSQTIRVKSKNIQYQIVAVDTMDFLTTGWTFTAETGGALTVDDTGCEQVLVNPIDIDDSFADANDGLVLVGALYNDVTGQMAKHDIKETVAEQMANDIHHNVTGTLAENLISLSVIPMSGDVSIPVSVTYCLNHHQQVGHDNVPGCAFWDFSINVPMAVRGMMWDAQRWKPLAVTPSVSVITQQTLQSCSK